MKAKIYKPTKTAMQSGTATNDFWLLEFASEDKKYIEPLMGWVGNRDTKQQLRMKFDSKEQAIAYAENNEIPFKLIEPKTRKFIKKSYADNFAYKSD